MEIRTPRLLLRPAALTDLADMHAVMSDARAMTYWSSLPHASIDETRQWLEAMMAIPAAQGEDFVVEHQGRVVGKAGLYRFPVIGFIFHPRVWRQGIAAEALRAVLERAFAVHGLDTVTGDVDPRNSACLNLLGRLGFRETGRAPRTWLIGDQWCDSIYLGLDAEVWQRTSEGQGKAHPAAG